jgi:urea transport system permease protein
MCYAIVAVAMDLIWGYTGILSLGHGLFFALGGYAFGMYLMRQIGRDGQYQSDMPDFMVFLDWKEFPWQWTMSDQFWWCALLVVAVPGLLAFVFGFFAFRSRVRGVYFSIITQALTFAAMLLFFRNATGFGGNNGFTDFKRVLGFAVTTPETRIVIFMITGATLIGTLLLARYIVTSRLGRVLTAIRDAEARVAFAATTRCTTNCSYGRCRPCCAHRGPLRPRWGSSIERDVPGRTDQIAIWVAVAVAALRAHQRGLVNGAKSLHAHARILAPVRGCFHPHHAVPAGAWSGCFRRSGESGEQSRHAGHASSWNRAIFPPFGRQVTGELDATHEPLHLESIR